MLDDKYSREGDDASTMSSICHFMLLCEGGTEGRCQRADEGADVSALPCFGRCNCHANAMMLSFSKYETNLLASFVYMYTSL